MAEGTAPRPDIPVFRNEPTTVLILGFVTCGLYMIYWNMKAAEVFNKIAGRELIAPGLAAVAGCCLPLNVYFYYVISQVLGDLGALIGKREELAAKSTMLIVLGLFLSPVAAWIIQGHLNELYDRA
jgi:Domain of unknown function (DUF4234)